MSGFLFGFTSAKEVVFLADVSLSAGFCKNCQAGLSELFGGVQHGPGEKLLQLWADRVPCCHRLQNN